MYRGTVEYGQTGIESVPYNLEQALKHTVDSSDDLGKIDLVFLVKIMLEHIQVRYMPHMTGINRLYFTKGMHELFLLVENIR